MVKIPKFDKNDWTQITEYASEIGKFDRPDNSTEAIFTIPLAIALLESAEKTEKLNKILIAATYNTERLNKILIGLTVVLAVLTLVSTYKLLCT
jgi:hypothetical protein